MLVSQLASIATPKHGDVDSIPTDGEKNQEICNGPSRTLQRLPRAPQGQMDLFNNKNKKLHQVHSTVLTPMFPQFSKVLKKKRNVFQIK